MANSSFWDAVKHRRTYYQLSDESVISDEKIHQIVKDVITYSPSSFNSQTTRALILLGAEHKKLWEEVVKPAVKAVAPAEAWPASEKRLSGFGAAYGTVLWFEDQNALEGLQKQIPLYADRFPQWSEHASGIHQYVAWTALEEAGFGANLQHYNPLIDEKVQQLWSVPKEWVLKAQLVFGKPTGEPGDKATNPLDERVLIHGGKLTIFTPELPVLIVGGGIVGLALAQALKQASIPFEIYEWDANLDATSRGGWAITIHWALDALRECLPPALFERVKDIQVDPEQGRNDTGKFLFLDMATAKPKFEVPPSTRLRVNRGLFRNLLTEGIDVHWNKIASGFEIKTDGGEREWVELSFQDGTTARGSLLIGADGANSRTRHGLLAVKAMGVTARMTPAQVATLRQIDPLLFQGCHPQTGVFMWYSIISSPEINGSSSSSSDESAFYEGQVILSWRYKPGADDDEVPSTNAARVAKMKALVQPFEARIKAVVEALSDDTPVLELKLQDWPTREWDNRNGRVTLAGDAAHPMTMYRGEGFNHGITDAANLSRHLISVVSSLAGTQQPPACLDAHDFHNLNSSSPLLSKRARVPKPGIAAE
ncbi:hypothetical protein DV738_g148, partial [Chaetothyriales sp. CBS 135597]